MDQRLLLPVNPTQIEIRCNAADFIPYPVRNQRGIRIVEHDAFFAIEPAFVFINSRDNSVEADWKNSVSEHSPFSVEGFTLPGKQVHDLRYFLAELSARSNDRCPFRGSIGNVSRGVVREKL